MIDGDIVVPFGVEWYYRVGAMRGVPRVTSKWKVRSNERGSANRGEM